MTNTILQHIQTLQFKDKQAAEALLLSFIHDIFDLDVELVELRPLAVSLNSFNGFLTLSNGSRLFFKTHTEPDNVIGEYYNAAILAKAGYPVIQPIYSSTEADKHLLVYEIIESPSVFDVAWEIENNKNTLFAVLTLAQNNADDDLLRLYINTLDWQTAENAENAPVHQLFYHRLARGRLARFYNPNQPINLPQKLSSMREVCSIKWQINGSFYRETLSDIIAKSIQLLAPGQAGPSIIGHGDAHNGNVFFHEQRSLLYFDPAFAGRHHPLLDLTKPLFHNVFAMWMYFPQEKQTKTTISLKINGDVWEVTHNYTLHPVRRMFLESKVKRVLIPALAELKNKGWLDPNWRSFLKASLFCCPFLTMNLTDSSRFTPEISLLGLAMAVEMGAESTGERSLIDQILDEVQDSL